MSEQRTSISAEPHHPLEVGYVVRSPHIRLSDDTWKQVERHRVSLSIPQDSERYPLYLLDIAPRTALNLLAWLEGERDTLERLAQEEV